MTVEVFAPAKVNLTLHITGRRDDGYHLLDSLVAFGPAGDVLRLDEADGYTIAVDGPEAEGVPSDATNLALQAARLLRCERGAAITLTKYLPAASGIGGGSADAAAAARAALMLEDRAAAERGALGPEILGRTDLRPLLGLGADIPMCLLPRPLRARGIGDNIVFAELPPLAALLVNPRVPVPTRDVFAALGSPDNAPMPGTLPGFPDAAALIDWLAIQRNDLEAPAMSRAPAIGDVLEALRGTRGCGLARMSGSGATCFGLYPDGATATAAGEAIRAARPDWWVAGGILGSQFDRSMPRLI